MDVKDSAPQTGVAATLAPDLRCILAPNASPMTYWGTNTYLLGRKQIAVIDPGPKDAMHLQAICEAVPEGGDITHILVTHAHLDHSPLARELAEATGAPVSAFGPATRGRSKIMQDLLESGFKGGGEGIDHDFHPDLQLDDGDRIETPEWSLDVLHTPGHMGNHLSFAWGDALFCGDHVMGWASSLVSPPDGDLTDFMASCHRLQAKTWSRFYAGHGLPIESPNARLEWLITHRLGRESSILAALAKGPRNASELAKELYVDTPQSLLPAAARNVFAHLIDLFAKNQVIPDGDIAFSTVFALREL